MQRTISVLIAIGVLIASAGTVCAQRYVAYSLRQAIRLTQEGKRDDSELTSLGGVTRVIGVIHDAKHSDLVLVGADLRELPPIYLDDLVTALRVRLVHDVWPMVSIDAPPRTPEGRPPVQIVRFRGPLPRTTFGGGLLNADLILKGYSLELLHPVEDVKSYKKLRVESVIESIESGGGRIRRVRWLTAEDTGQAVNALKRRGIVDDESYEFRFWFYPHKPYNFVPRAGIFCIEELRIEVLERLIAVPGQSGSAGPESVAPQYVAQPAKEFADTFTQRFQAIAAAFPELDRLKCLFDLVAIAQGIAELESDFDLTYLLSEYPLSDIEMPDTVDLTDLCCLIEKSDGSVHAVRISGGVELRPEIRRLNGGRVEMLQKIVIESRPTPDALTWQLDLSGWNMLNAHDLENVKKKLTTRPVSRWAPRRTGSTLFEQSVVLAPPGKQGAPGMGRFDGFDSLPVNGTFVNPAPVRGVRELGGVSMRMEISEESFIRRPDGKLKSLRDSILKGSSSADALDRPAENNEEK